MTRKRQQRRSDRLRACVFTAQAEGSSVPLGSLAHFEMPRFKQQFRGHVNRAMRALGGNPGGLFFAGLHGSYDPKVGTFALHWHGVVTGGMIDVIDVLRGLRMYAPAQPGDGRDAIRTPIRMSDRPLYAGTSDLPSSALVELKADLFSVRRLAVGLPGQAAEGLGESRGGIPAVPGSVQA